MADRRPLPPMSTLEHAISNTFRHSFFALKLVLAWALVLVPAFALAMLPLRGLNLQDAAHLPPHAIAILAVLGVLVLLALLSMGVNWQRRLLLGESPKGLAWWRLDGHVWRSLFAHLMVFVALAIFAALAAAMKTFGEPWLTARIGGAAKPVTILVLVILGIIGLTTGYRLAVKLPGVAIGRRDYKFRHAWGDTRRNTLRFLGFTFWYLFSLAVAGAICAGAFFAQKAEPTLWAQIAAAVVIALAIWFALWMSLTVFASMYSYWGEKKDFPSPV
ncbi:hypothetical protein [Aestuariivirga sp.]|uniref:hypothetical protein n=1 Tax=Aestuariivirga sp. TaxID=2650926 RepID=UPI0039E249DC